MTNGPDGRRLSHAASIRNMVEQAEVADRAGLDYFGIGEHHIEELIGILLLQARAKASLSAQGDALNALNEAVTLAQPEGYLRTFVEEGPEIFELLRRGQGLGMWSSSPVKEYVSGLLGAFTSSI